MGFAIDCVENCSSQAGKTHFHPDKIAARDDVAKAFAPGGVMYERAGQLVIQHTRYLRLGSKARVVTGLRVSRGSESAALHQIH